jgi:Protein of unknown function (DUF3515)
VNDDQPTRSAGRIATLVAVPVALLAGFIAFQALKPEPPAAKPSPTASAREMPTTPVTVAAAPLNERQAGICRAVVDRLPAQVRGMARRPVIGAAGQAAAYGDGLVLTCGGPQPSFAPSDLVYAISGVCWVPDGEGSRWTTVDRDVPIELRLPASAAGAGSGQWAAAFSEAIAATVPQLASRPSGCP